MFLGLEVGSWADWFSAIGTIAAVFLTVWISYKERKRIRNNEKKRQENELSKFKRISEGIESAIAYDVKANHIEIREVWKDQLTSLIILKEELQKEFHTYDAGTVDRFINMIIDENDTHDIDELKNRLSAPLRDFNAIIKRKEKELEK